MSASPPKPFYLIPPTLFTPAFQTTNGDGSIGNGSFQGVYWVVGHVMTIVYFLTWGGTTAGTGSTLLSLPASWTAANIDTAKMPFLGPVAFMPTDHYSQSLAGVLTGPPGSLNIIGTTRALTPNIPALIAAGDFLAWKIQIPLVDNLPP